ncbi:MAG TPA: hypothetical protein VK462_10655, partial [Nitrososphaeraceae archaeon]|nr:hypothetical protein [Nitrososphaeraceae archaeon]
SAIDNRTHLIYKSEETQTEIELFDYIDGPKDVLIDITCLGIVVLLILVTEYKWFVYFLSLLNGSFKFVIEFFLYRRFKATICLWVYSRPVFQYSLPMRGSPSYLKLNKFWKSDK